MPLITPTLESAPPIEPLQLWRLTVQQYHQMRDGGILTEGDAIELLDGLLVEKMTKNPPHRIATHLMRDLLEELGLVGCYVETQEPITLTDSEPEPDVAVIRGTIRDYEDQHPGAADVILVIEVADSTLERDRTVKSRIYAQAGIPSFWIVNLVDRCLEVHRNPVGDRYQSRQVFREDESGLITIGDRQHDLDIKQFLPKLTAKTA
jgi:Uma2 family endonuclease